MGHFFYVLSFATLQAFGKVLEVIERQISLKGFARISAPSFKNTPEILSIPATSKCQYFTLFSRLLQNRF